MLCFAELTSKLRKALESTPKDVADSGSCDSGDWEALIEPLRTFCLESKDDFAVSQLRSQDSKNSFISVVLSILKKFCPNSEWTTDSDDFFRDFVEAMDDRYELLGYALDALRICFRERLEIDNGLTPTAMQQILLCVPLRCSMVSELALRSLTNAMANDLATTDIFFGGNGIRLDHLLTIFCDGSLAPLSLQQLNLRLLYMLSSQSFSIASKLRNGNEMSIISNTFCKICTDFNRDSIWRNAIQDGCKLICVILDKLDSSREDFNKSIFSTILQGASAVVTGVAEPPNSDVVSSSIEVVMFTCSTHYPYNDIASDVYIELYARILAIKLDAYRRSDLELSRKTSILLSILVVLSEASSRLPSARERLKSIIFLENTTLKDALIEHMISFDTTVKRYVSELMFTLCDECGEIFY